MKLEEYVNKMKDKPFHGYLKTRYKEYQEAYGEISKEKFLNYILNVNYQHIYIDTKLVKCNRKKLTLDGEYALATLYKDDLSNIPTWSVNVGGMIKCFLSEDEALAEWGGVEFSDLKGYRNEFKSIKALNWSTDFKNKRCLTLAEYANLKHDGFSHDVQDALAHKNAIMCPTTANWCGTFSKGYVLVQIRRTVPELDIYTLLMLGNDDFSMSLDIIGEEEARKVWKQVVCCKDLQPDTFKDAWFSN